MKVIPVASPAAIPPQGTPEHVRTAKAVAAFNRGASSYDAPAANQQPAQQQVQNQNAIAVEELGAIQAQVIDNETPSEAAETVEETPVEAPAPKQEDQALSRQFAQLARQEKANRAKDQALKAREAALAAREAALTSNAPDMSKYIPRERLTQETLQVLAEAGVSYDDITQQLVNQVPTDPRVQATISRLEAKIQKLEQQGEDSKKSQSQSQQQAYDAAVAQIRVDAKKLVFTDPSFETIKVTNSVNDVVELITQTYDKDGILLSVEEAAQQVEDYLMEEATKLARIDKIQKRLQANSAKSATSQAKPQPPKQLQPQPMKTLTNNTSSTRQLSAKERAILAFKGELK